VIRILHQIFRTGIVTEPLPAAAEPALEQVGAQLEAAIRRRFRGSLTIRQVDAGSCNGCELEIHAIGNPIYDCERFGMHFTASPRFADLLLVTGPVTFNMEIALRRTYAATPAPKLVIAVGDCGRDGGIFGTSYASLGGIGNVIPVDGVIPGCPPTPEALLRGILAAVAAAR
jgi:Ni,Fe-hydrogenase III small subunit